MFLPSAISAAPAPARALGRDLLVSPLADADFDELSLWYQARVLRIARASLGPEATVRERDEMLQAASRHAASIDFMTEFQLLGGNRSGPIAEKEALAQFAWRLLRRANRPAVTLDEARQIVQTGDGLAEILDAWQLVQFGERKTEAEADGKKADPTESAP